MVLLVDAGIQIVHVVAILWRMRERGLDLLRFSIHVLSHRRKKLTDTLAIGRARNLRLVALAIVLQAAGALAVAALVVAPCVRLVLALADFRPAFAERETKQE